MRTEDEISAKCKHLIKKRWKERRLNFLSRKTINCEYRSEAKIKNVGKVFVCGNKEISCKKIEVCNDSRASGCPLFKCRNKEYDVEMEFDEILRNPSDCGRLYPKIAILLWILEGNIFLDISDRFPKCSFLRSILSRFKFWKT
tara:strand:- start:5343 stop:5771 length:429 start_codon:yes stop_codon:yes gene_type:complete